MSDTQWICWAAALCAVSLCLAVVLWAWRPRHQHDWKMTSYATTAVYFNKRDGDLPARFVTDISLICRDCGEPRIKTVDGRWSSETQPTKEHA